MVGSSQDRNPSGRRFQGKKRALTRRRRSLRRETRREKKVRGFEANSDRKACKTAVQVKEKEDYQKKKAGERKVKKEGSVAPAGEVRDKVWAEAHQGVDQKGVHKRKSDNECTRCGMKNQAWKYCQKPIQVSAIYQGQAMPKRQSTFAPTRPPQVATVAVDGDGESSKRALQRPPAWAFDDVDSLQKVTQVPTTTVFG